MFGNPFIWTETQIHFNVFCRRKSVIQVWNEWE